jgi:hypothetical protein
MPVRYGPWTFFALARNEMESRWRTQNGHHPGSAAFGKTASKLGFAGVLFYDVASVFVVAQSGKL